MSDYRYDVFLSHNSLDKVAVEWLASKLTDQADLTVFLDKWNLVPGDPWQEELEKALLYSNTVVVFLGPPGISGWHNEELRSALTVRVNDGGRRVIPVLLPDTVMPEKNEIPSFLQRLTWVDFRSGLEDDEAFRRLVAGIKGEAPGRYSESKKKDDSIEIEICMEESFEFVNRNIELATLEPSKLDRSYWQYALISAPTGYGKSRLLKRLLANIQKEATLSDKWDYRYIDLKDCDNLEYVVDFIVKKITKEIVTRNFENEDLKNKVCDYILEEMSIPARNGIVRGVLLIIDSIDYLPSEAREWLASVMHEAIVSSYIDYEYDIVSFPVRIILAGVDTQSFLDEYLDWEISSNRKYGLKLPQKLALSAFNDMVIQELVRRRAEKEGISLESSSIPFISTELRYLSGGHPQIVNKILDELVKRKFRQYRNYLRENREQLVKRHISEVVKKVLQNYPIPQDKKDIKTICVFRLNNFDSLQELHLDGLVSSQVDIRFLATLCENNILKRPNSNLMFYHDDIIRRILYLEFALGLGKDEEQVQKTHQCARNLYGELIKLKNEQNSLHLFFAEWLFHSLHVADFTKDKIVEEWMLMLSNIQSTSLPTEDLISIIKEKIEVDSEIKYQYRERFGTIDFSLLFDFDAMRHNG